MDLPNIRRARRDGSDDPADGHHSDPHHNPPLNLADEVGFARNVAFGVMRSWPLREWEDGLGDAMVGLCLAARDFSEDGGASFETYASHRIKGTMLDGVRRRNGRRNQGSFVAHPKTTPLDQGLFEPRTGWRRLDPPDPRAEERFTEVVREDLSRRAVQFFDRLSDQDRLLMTLYFFEGMGLREIGETVGLTESRVSQIVTQACQRLLRLLDN